MVGTIGRSVSSTVTNASCVPPPLAGWAGFINGKPADDEVKPLTCGLPPDTSATAVPASKPLPPRKLEYAMVPLGLSLITNASSEPPP